MKVDISLANNVSTPLATMASASAIHGAIQRKMCGRGVIRAGKGIILVILNENMDDIIRIIKSMENLGLLIDGVIKTVKYEIKKQEGGFLSMLLGTLDASVLGNMLTGKGVMKAGRRYNNIDHMDKNF